MVTPRLLRRSDPQAAVRMESRGESFQIRQTCSSTERQETKKTNSGKHGLFCSGSAAIPAMNSQTRHLRNAEVLCCFVLKQPAEFL